MKIRLIIATITVMFCFTSFGNLACAYDFGDFRSDTLVKKADKSFKEDDLEGMFAYTDKCLEMYEKQAKAMQEGLVAFPGGADGEIYKFWALNDVARSIYIQGIGYLQSNRLKEAKASFQKIIDQYSFGQYRSWEGWEKLVELAKEKMEMLSNDHAKLKNRIIEVYDPKLNPMKLNQEKGITHYKKYGESFYSGKPINYKDYGIYRLCAEEKCVENPQVEESSDGVLNIKSSLNNELGYGISQWVSVRKQFDAPKDLSKAEGLRITYRILSSNKKDYLLRFTFCDHENREFLMYKDGLYAEYSRQDDMWWYDTDWKEPSVEWIILDIPFSNLVLPKRRIGVRVSGLRIGDFKAKNFNAYEINLINVQSPLKIEIEVASIEPYSKN